jgi:hypothetical protein
MLFMFQKGGYMVDNDKPQDPAQPKKPQEDQSGTALTLDIKGWIAPIVAVLILIALAFLYIFLLKNVNAVSETWQRLTYLLEGIEAIAFAAMGYLFGSEVHRKQAEDAKEGEQQAKEDADKANQRASNAEVGVAEVEAKGNALKVSILAKFQAQETKGVGYRTLSGSQTSQFSEADFQELADLAKQLFP